MGGSPCPSSTYSRRSYSMTTSQWRNFRIYRSWPWFYIKEISIFIVSICNQSTCDKSKMGQLHFSFWVLLGMAHHKCFQLVLSLHLVHCNDPWISFKALDLITEPHKIATPPDAKLLGLFNSDSHLWFHLTCKVCQLNALCSHTGLG